MSAAAEVSRQKCHIGLGWANITNDIVLKVEKLGKLPDGRTRAARKKSAAADNYAFLPAIQAERIVQAPPRYHHAHIYVSAGGGR